MGTAQAGRPGASAGRLFTDAHDALRGVVADGQIPHFTGIDSPYEAPEAPELHLKTTEYAAEVLAEQIVQRLRQG